MDLVTVIGLLEAILLPAMVGAGIFIARQSGRIARTEKDLEQAKADLAELKGDYRKHAHESVELLQRVATMEANIKAVREDIGEIKDTIQRLLDKKE